MPELPNDVAPTPPPAPGETPAPAAPPEPPLPRFHQRPGFRGAVWVVAVFVALLLIGMVFSPRYWRF